LLQGLDPNKTVCDKIIQRKGEGIAFWAREGIAFWAREGIAFWARIVYDVLCVSYQ